MEQFNNDLKLAGWTKSIKPSAMQESVAYADDPEFISFALGLPDCSLFPKNVVYSATQALLAEDRNSLFQYSQPLPKLKHQIVNIMKARGVSCNENEIFLTAGAQQGINLLTRLLLDKGDNIVVENFAYPGFLQSIEPYSPNVITVDTNFEGGVDIGQVEKAFSIRPTLLYLVPDGGNPHGATISQANREKLVELAHEYKVPIIEDDPYGLLCYENNPIPPIRALNDNWVFYIGSFSKILAPSFRIGWLVIPSYLQNPLSILKEGTDINIATYSQRLASKILEILSIEDHVNKIKFNYKEKRDLMFEQLRSFFPKETVLEKPKSGLFFWLKLPKYINTQKLFDLCLKKYKVAFIPGNSFAIKKCDDSSQYIRLNFSVSSRKQIVEGISRLASALSELTENKKKNSDYLPKFEEVK